jgi:hypothetical protein
VSIASGRHPAGFNGMPDCFFNFAGRCVFQHFCVKMACLKGGIMKRELMVLTAVCLLAGCSKEQEKSVQRGGDIADQIQKPLNEARAVYEKARKSRDVELPQ